MESDQSGQILPQRDHVLIGKERTDVGRPHNWGYPIRGIVTDEFLYLRNYEPTRWPAGNPETGYLDTDGSSTKTLILVLGRSDRSNRFWQLNFGLRPADELYDLRTDAAARTILVHYGNPAHLVFLHPLTAVVNRRIRSRGDNRVRHAAFGGHLDRILLFSDRTADYVSVRHNPDQFPAALTLHHRDRTAVAVDHHASYLSKLRGGRATSRILRHDFSYHCRHFVFL